MSTSDLSRSLRATPDAAPVDVQAVGHLPTARQALAIAGQLEPDVAGVPLVLLLHPLLDLGALIVEPHQRRPGAIAGDALRPQLLEALDDARDKAEQERRAIPGRSIQVTVASALTPKLAPLGAPELIRRAHQRDDDVLRDLPIDLTSHERDSIAATLHQDAAVVGLRHVRRQGLRPGAALARALHAVRIPANAALTDRLLGQVPSELDVGHGEFVR